MVETWRIETSDTVHAVEVVRRGACWAVASDGDHTVLHSTPRVAVQAWAFRNSVMGLVLAPGEPTRAEAVAAVASSRDDARAEVETLRAEAALMRESSACERCGGRRAVAKMSGPIPCPACVPRVRVPCPYCAEGVALGTGETCRECDGGVR